MEGKVSGKVWSFWKGYWGLTNNGKKKEICKASLAKKWKCKFLLFHLKFVIHYIYIYIHLECTHINPLLQFS